MARRLGMLRPAAGRRADGERGRAKNTFNSPCPSKRVREAPACVRACVPYRNIRFADRARSASGSAPRRAAARLAGAPRAGRRCSGVAPLFCCGAASPVRPVTASGQTVTHIIFNTIITVHAAGCRGAPSSPSRHVAHQVRRLRHNGSTDAVRVRRPLPSERWMTPQRSRAHRTLP